MIKGACLHLMTFSKTNSLFLKCNTKASNKNLHMKPPFFVLKANFSHVRAIYIRIPHLSCPCYRIAKFVDAQSPPVNQWKKYESPTKCLLAHSCVCIRFRKRGMPMVLMVRNPQTDTENHALSKLILWAYVRSCLLIKDQWLNTSEMVEVLKRFWESLIILPPSNHKKTVHEHRIVRGERVWIYSLCARQRERVTQKGRRR